MQQSGDDDRVAHLTNQLERLRHELLELQQVTRRPRASGLRGAGRVMAGVPLLVIGAWVLSAGAPANQDDLEQRVSELEARLLKGPGSTTRIQAPFEVVGPGGNVIFQVSQSIPTMSQGIGVFSQGALAGVVVSRGGHDVAGLGTSEDGNGGVLYIGDQYGVPRAEARATTGLSVLDGSGGIVASMVALDEAPFGGRFALMRGKEMIASLEENDEGPLLDISDEKGKSVAQMGIEEGNGYIATLDDKGYGEVEMGMTDGGEPQLSVRQKGKVRASLRLSTGAGHLAISNSKDVVVANVTGSGAKDGGAVIVGNGSGEGVANMAASADGSGLVQVFQPGGKAVAVMAQDKAGGLLQIKDGSGTPVANLKASSSGGGYMQLTDPAGTPVVEGGFDEGSGIVRAGPYYRCSATAQNVPLIGTVRLPDCIRGRNKP
jgi:hypothetical protein